jgi:hypothetical protein
MQDQWKNAAIEAAGAGFNGRGYDGKDANARRSASGRGLVCPGVAWLHRGPALVTPAAEPSSGTACADLHGEH